MQVTPDELGPIRSRIISQNLPSSSGNLEGMKIDFYYYLEQARILNIKSVKKTGNKHHMLDVQCVPAKDGYNKTEITKEVQRVWLDCLCYREFEAHSIVETDSKIVLEFVTLMKPDGPFVTGSIVANISSLRASNTEK